MKIEIGSSIKSKVGTSHLIHICCPRGNYGIQKWEEGLPKNRGMVKQTNSHIRHQLKKMMLQELEEIENC